METEPDKIVAAALAAALLRQNPALKSAEAAVDLYEQIIQEMRSRGLWGSMRPPVLPR